MVVKGNCSGLFFYDDNGMPLVEMHWQHRFNHMIGRYNDIYWGRCQISRLMCADIPTAVTKRKRE